MYVDRHTPGGGGAEGREYLCARRARRVRDAHADAQRAVAQPSGETLGQRRELRGHQALARPWAVDHDDGTPFTRRVALEDRAARSGVRHRRSIIDTRLSFARRVPRVHRVRAKFQFERGGHAVTSHESVVRVVLAVGMQINEARRHDETPRIDGVARRRRRGAHEDDFAVLDADRADGVESRLGIDDASADNDNVERGGALSAEWCCQNHGQRKQRVKACGGAHEIMGWRTLLPGKRSRSRRIRTRAARAGVNAPRVAPQRPDLRHRS